MTPGNGAAPQGQPGYNHNSVGSTLRSKLSPELIDQLHSSELVRYGAKVHNVGMVVLRSCVERSSSQLVSGLLEATMQSFSYEGTHHLIKGVRGQKFNNRLAVNYLTKVSSMSDSSWLRNMPAENLAEYLESQCGEIDRRNKDPRKLLGEISVELTQADILLPNYYQVARQNADSPENKFSKEPKRLAADLIVALFPKIRDEKHLRWEKRQLEKAAGEFIFDYRRLDGSLPPQVELSNQDYKNFIIDSYRFKQLYPGYKLPEVNSLCHDRQFEDPHFSIFKLDNNIPMDYAREALSAIQETLDGLSPEQRTIRLLPVKAATNGNLEQPG